MASNSVDGIKDEVVCFELPAPAGWNKKLVLKKGGTPKKNEVIFTSPSGDLLTSRKQLEQYLKSHPGGPTAAEFDWGTGETPRRSARISGKAKAVSPLDSQSPKKKRSIKSSSLKKKEDAEDTKMEDAEKPEKEIIAPAEAETDAQKEAVKEKEKEAVEEKEKEAAEDVPGKDEEAPKIGQTEEEGEKPEPVKDEAMKEEIGTEAVDTEKKEESGEKTDAQIKEAAEPAPVEAGKSNGTEESVQNGDEVKP